MLLAMIVSGHMWPAVALFNARLDFSPENVEELVCLDWKSKECAAIKIEGRGLENWLHIFICYEIIPLQSTSGQRKEIGSNTKFVPRN